MDQFERRQYAIAIEMLLAVKWAERAGHEARDLIDPVDAVFDYIEGVRASRLKSAVSIY